MTALAERIAAVPRPAPRPSTILSYAVMVAVLGLGVWSFAELDFTPKGLEATRGNISRFLTMATPMQWPGWNVAGERQADGTTTFTTTWVGFEPIQEMLEVIAITLALVIAGTVLAALLSIPVAYGAASNTTPNAVVQALCRGIGVVARAIPDVVFVMFLVFLWNRAGTLAAIVAIGLHSVGMISKMFADAIEQIDEGPRLAVRSTGGSKAQVFWAGVVPQALPAWIAVTLHRADINLRGTVILGVVGVAGVGYELNEALHAGPSGMRRSIPLVVIIIALCVLFEIVSSMLRAKLLNVRPTGKGVGDTVTRAISRGGAGDSHESPTPTHERHARIEAALHRPWDRHRVTTNLWVWIGILVVIVSFLYAKPDVGAILSPSWDQIVNEERGRALWPPTFGSRDLLDVRDAVATTLQIAFAATLMATILSAVIGPLSARNVAPARWIRNLCRAITLVVRAVPDLVVAILFIIAAGIGPQAGALALGIGGVGLLAKLIGDSMEEVPSGPERAVTATGGTRSQVFFSSTLPLSIPAMVAHLMYLLEQNIRAATLLGIVGAGGIGFLLINALQGRSFDQVLGFALVVVALVFVVEAVSVQIRRALR